VVSSCKTADYLVQYYQYEKKVLTLMNNNSTNINKTNNHLSLQLIEHKKDRHMMLEIQVHVWDRHKNEAALNQLIVFIRRNA
jgi:hypothetical protein